MDKLELLLEMIEHPERFTEQQISELLADEEMRKHYDVMVQLRGAYLKKEDPPLHRIAAIFLAAAFLGGLAWAFVPLLHTKKEASHTAEVTTLPLEGERGGGLSGGVGLRSFSNLPLDSILAVVSAHYNCEVCFRDSAAMGMKFITTWNPEDSLAAFIEHLNMFDGLHLTLQDDTIFVDTDPLPAPPKGGE